MGGEFENVSRGKVRRVLEPSRIMMVVIPKGDGVNILPICFHNWCGFKPSLYLAAIHNVNYSYELMEAAKEFVLAVPGRSMADEVEYFGTVSGRDRDKVKDFGTELIESKEVRTAGMAKALANIECRVVQKFITGDHICAVGEVVNIRMRKGAESQRPLLTIAGEQNGYIIVKRFGKHVIAVVE